MGQLQFLIGILGILGGFALILLTRKKKKDSRPAFQPEIRRKTVKELIRAPQNLADLCFIFAASAYLALILTDSFVISGRTPMADVFSLILVTMIALLPTLFLLFGWYQNRSEVSLGITAATVLVVMTFAPGGPFIESVHPLGETGISLLLPQMVLLTIITGSVIYIYGNPFSKSLPRSQKFRIYGMLGACLLLAFFGRAVQYENIVMHHPNTPNSDPGPASDLMTDVRYNLNATQQSQFYQLASEVSLNGYYREQFQDKRLALRPPKRPGVADEDVSVFQNPRFKALFERDQDDEEEGEYNYRSRNKRKSLLIDPALQNEARDLLTEDLHKKFKRLTPEQQVTYFYDRTRWVHPLGVPGIRANYDLPGISPKQRILTLSNARIVTSLLSREVLKDNYLKLFDYDEDVEEYLSQRRGSVPVRYDDIYYDDDWDQSVIPWSVFNDNRNAGLKLDFLFPALSSQYSSLLLRQDLGLPLDFETYLTYENYLHLAVQLEPDLIVKERFNHFAFEFDPESQGALLHLLHNDSSNAMFSTLVYYSDLDFSHFSAYDDPASVANLLSYVNEYLNPDGADQEPAEGRPAESAPSPAPAPAYDGPDFSQAPAQVREQLEAALEDPSASPLPQEAVEQYRQWKQVQGGGMPAPAMAAPASGSQLRMLAQSIAEKLTAENDSIRDTMLAGLEAILINDDPQVPSRYFFRPELLSFYRDVDALDSTRKATLIDRMSYPNRLILERVSERMWPEADTSENIFPAYLDKFAALDQHDKETVLHHLAVRNYRAGGSYSLNPLEMLVVKAKVLSGPLATLFAGLYWVPLLLLAMLTGGFFARKLVSRELMRKVLASEEEISKKEAHELGAAVEFTGRESVLNKLVTLAGRGWATIALVGRRGIGKSRVLYELSKENPDPNKVTRISAWVAAPSKYTEEDFISSVLERLAFNTENTIARYLGAKPLSVRRAESSGAMVMIFLFVAALVLVGASRGLILDRLVASDIDVMWIPVHILTVVSGAFLIFHLTRIQPVNLSGWLQRDRSHNAHAVFLYQETQAVLKFLNRRKSRQKGGFVFWTRDIFRQIVLFNLSGTSIVFFALALIFFLERFRFDFNKEEVFLCLGLSALFALLARLVALRKPVDTDADGDSLMTLVSRYRSYAGSIVSRLRSGAFGGAANDEGHVVICIDEVDKIVEMSETRAFVRQIKALFEIPGVYYYVSLAEDALQAMYLGTAEGKNEIDSSFDHVVRIAPFALPDTRQIASRYLEKRGYTGVENHRAALMLAAVSFGVARDIFRRSDEFLSGGPDDRQQPANTVQRFRHIQVQLAYNAHRLNKDEFRELMGEANEVVTKATELMQPGAVQVGREDVVKVLLMIRIVANIELILRGGERPDLADILARLADFGYRVPIEPVVDLVEELEPIEQAIASGGPKLLGNNDTI